MEKRIYYAAYGSNLNVREMAQRCPNATIVGTAELRNWRLRFNGCLTIEPHMGSTVQLGVWCASTDDERRLDYYEGFPSFYYKKNVKLQIHTQCDATIEHECIIYIMQPCYPFAPRMVSKVYYDRCIEGFHDFGFETQQLADALERSKKGV